MSDKSSAQEITLEENFEKLEELVKLLSDDELPLEQAFMAYSQGMEVLKQCNEQIDRVEKKVMMLNRETVLDENQ